jgi:hypothetical protein
VQTVAHPKERFHALLRVAYAETGREASAFRPHHADYYIAIADFIAATPQGFEPLLATQSGDGISTTQCNHCSIGTSAQLVKE